MYFTIRIVHFWDREISLFSNKMGNRSRSSLESRSSWNLTTSRTHAVYQSYWIQHSLFSTDFAKLTSELIETLYISCNSKESCVVENYNKISEDIFFYFLMKSVQLYCYIQYTLWNISPIFQIINVLLKTLLITNNLNYSLHIKTRKYTEDFV